MRIRTRLALAAFVPVLLGLVFCGGSRPTEKVVVAYFGSPSTLTLQVAIEKGYFRDEGLDVTLDSYDTAVLTLDALLRGEADFATSAETPFAHDVLDGKQISIVVTTCVGKRADSIVARRDRGITSFADLRGKTIGIVPDTVSEYFLQVYLILFNVNPADVRTVSVAPDEMVDALVNGNVDGISQASPMRGTLEEALGDNAVVLDDAAASVARQNVVVTQESAATNPQRIERFVRALVRADRFIERHPEDAHAISAEYLGADGSRYEDDWADLKFEVSLSDALIVSLEQQADWMIETGTPAAQMPNFLDFIYADALKAANPETMTIVGK
jgi:NitT/TauT family transport system substrate-binding protein